MKRLQQFFLFALILCFSAQLRAQTVIEAAFSPDGGAEALILKVIDASREKLRLPPIPSLPPPS